MSRRHVQNFGFGKSDSGNTPKLSSHNICRMQNQNNLLKQILDLHKDKPQLINQCLSGRSTNYFILKSKTTKGGNY